MSNIYQDYENITFEQDKLNREMYAQSLIDLINNSQNLTENNSFVIALDSPWGTGKSVFVNMMKNKIEQENSNINVVLYNAWDNDYCENPFEPLFYDIVRNNIFDDVKDNENIKELLKTIPKIATAFGKDLAKKSGIENTAEEFVKSATKFKDYVIGETPSFKKLDEERQAFKKFKKYLSKSSEWLEDNNHKLLIIIDELDRCKPIFAIKTLEIIKHLFDVTNIVFLLSVDFSQLKHSIATVYGQEMDSEGYLLRFVNHVLKLPEPSKMEYIDYLLDTYPLTEDKQYTNNFIFDLKKIFNYKDLSLRDINVIYNNFRMFFNSRNFNKTDNNLSLPYLMLMLFKYADLQVYNAFLSGDSNKVRMVYDYKGSPLIEKEEFVKLNQVAEGKAIKLLTSNCNLFRYLERNNYSSNNIFSHSDLDEIVSYTTTSKVYLFITYNDIIRYGKYYLSSPTVVQYLAYEIEIYSSNNIERNEQSTKDDLELLVHTTK